MSHMEINGLPSCQISISKDGRWYHKGIEMIRRDFIRMFFQNMEIDSHQRYIINWNGQRCQVDVEDTAFVIQRVVYEDFRPTGNARFVLYLSDDSREDLVPEILFAGPDNVLYCRVKNGAFPARFSRAAYYQIAEYIEEEDGSFFLPLNGKKYSVALRDRPDNSDISIHS